MQISSILSIFSVIVLEIHLQFHSQERTRKEELKVIKKSNYGSKESFD